METKFKINTFNDYLNSLKEKEEIINNIYDSFEKEFNTNIINLNRDIINNHIINKLDQLISQFSNSEIKTLEANKDSSLKTFQNELESLSVEKDSILGILTANLKQKKKVYTVKLASSVGIEGNFYLAYIGNTDNGNYTEVLTNEEDINLAKRYLEIDNEAIKIKNNINEVLDSFSIEAKKFNYIKNDFSDELNLLSKISNLNICSLSNLNDKSYIYLYGDVDDYDQYRTSIQTIMEKYKKLNEILAK